MVSGNGFYLDIDGKYKDIEDGEEIQIIELNHSEYGLIYYIVYNENNHIVNWVQTKEYIEIPPNWIDEIEAV